MTLNNLSFKTIISLSSILAIPAFAFDNSLFLANSPTSLENGETILGINHAFATKIINDGEVAENLNERAFGFKTANVSLTVDSLIWNGVAVKAYTSSVDSEYALGLAYNHPLNSYNLIMGADGFFFREDTKLHKSTYVYSAISTQKWKKSFVVPVLGLGYDLYNNLAAVTIGLSIPFTEEHALATEYHARISPNSKNVNLGKTNYYNIGYRWNTGDHQFFILAANTNAATERQANLGAAKFDNINLAFRVTRKF